MAWSEGMNLNDDIEGVEDQEIESKSIHIIYILLMSVGWLVIFQTSMMLILICAAVIIIIYQRRNPNVNINPWARNPNQVDPRRSAELIKAMKIFKVDGYIFKEVTECPICLDSFGVEDKVVQLQCSKYHIFHE